jgi:hypothetical protein
MSLVWWFKMQNAPNQSRPKPRFDDRGPLLEPVQEGVPFLTLRCVHAQKRPRPSWLVSVLRLRFSCSGLVVVLLVTNLTPSQSHLSRHHDAADVRLRSTGLEVQNCPTHNTKPPHVSDTSFTQARSATSTGVAERLWRLRSVFVDRALFPNVPSPPSSCIRRASQQQQTHLQPSKRRQQQQIESQLPAPSHPVQVPPTADRVL